jgi:hypothetical protein
MDYSKKSARSQGNRVATWLQIRFKTDITDELGGILPYPHRHEIQPDGTMVYNWLIDGLFLTLNGVEYINDIIARFMLTFPGNAHNPKTYIESKPRFDPIKLKHFQNLKSKVTQKKKSYTRADVQIDSTFWVLKYHAEELIRQDGFIIYQKLESFACDTFTQHKKGLSTIKAKCRSIWHWYEKRDWQIGRAKRVYETKEELMASRKEHMIKVNKKKGEETRQKVHKIVTGLLAQEYKKPNGKWHITKIAKDSGVGRDSVYKYLKELA